ncbi:ABC transporter permease [bacterium]|nr:ABC transporter permease [bacterium]
MAMEAVASRPIARLDRRIFLALPALIWFLGFLLIPLFIVVIYSLATRGEYGAVTFNFSLGNYFRIFDSVYLKIFLRSLQLAAVTSISCLLLGFPVAYVMATASPRWRQILMAMVVIPFWTNFVIRAYAIKFLLSDYGLINSLGMFLHLWSEPIYFSNSAFSVWLGMVTNYIPFMILPLYVSLEKFDFTMLEAARDLGASSWNSFWKVLVPLIKTGLITGLIFVFTPALGEFVVPDLLGGAKTMLIGNLITEQFMKTRDWPFGSALSLLLIVAVLVSLTIYLTNRDSRVQH